MINLDRQLEPYELFTLKQSPNIRAARMGAMSARGPVQGEATADSPGAEHPRQAGRLRCSDPGRAGWGTSQGRHPRPAQCRGANRLQLGDASV